MTARHAGPELHRYLSTGCLHGQHGYCQKNTGLAGAKTAASCKFCKAPCICHCHRAVQVPEQPATDNTTPAPAPDALPARVQASADLLRHLALAATPGTWTTHPVTYGTAEDDTLHVGAYEIHAHHRPAGLAEVVVGHQTHEGGGIHHQATADYITAMQPEVGHALARLLDTIAERMRHFEAAGLSAASLADPGIVLLVDAVLAATTTTEGTGP